MRKASVTKHITIIDPDGKPNYISVRQDGGADGKSPKPKIMLDAVASLSQCDGSERVREG